MAAVRYLEFYGTNNVFFKSPCRDAQNRVRANWDHCWSFSVRFLQSYTEILIDNLTWLILILSQHLIQLTG